MSAARKGRTRTECVTHMKAAKCEDVMPFRPGPVRDDSDSDSDDESGVSEGGLKFWLGVVVQQWLIAEEDIEVYSTMVMAGHPYITVQWLEVDEEADESGQHLKYELSEIRDCITGVRIEGILPVKKLRKVSLPRTKPGDVPKKATYNLNEVSAAQILSFL